MNDMKPPITPRPSSSTGQPPRLVMRAQPIARKPRSPTDKVVKTIELKLHVPQLNLPGRLQGLRARLSRMSRKRRLLLAGALVLLIVSAVVFYWPRQTDTASTVSGSQNPLDQLQKGTPDYPTIVPAGKSIDDLGGWTRISPPEREPVYAYVDKINSVPISVSQQPLPASFKSDPAAKVRDLALSQSADKTLQVDSNKAYVGTSKNGPQSVIYHTDTLLILIKSNDKIEDEEWKKYIQSLS